MNTVNSVHPPPTLIPTLVNTEPDHSSVPTQLSTNTQSAPAPDSTETISGVNIVGTSDVNWQQNQQIQDQNNQTPVGMLIDL